MKTSPRYMAPNASSTHGQTVSRRFCATSPQALASEARSLAAFLQTAALCLSMNGPASPEENEGLELCFDLLRDYLDVLPGTGEDQPFMV